MTLSYHKVKTNVGDIFIHLNSNKSLHFTSDNAGHYAYRDPVVINGNNYRVSGHYENNGSEWKMCNTFSINKCNSVKFQDYSKSARDKAIAAIEAAVQFFVSDPANRPLFNEALNKANEEQKHRLAEKIQEKKNELQALVNAYNALG